MTKHKPEEDIGSSNTTGHSRSCKNLYPVHELIAAPGIKFTLTVLVSSLNEGYFFLKAVVCRLAKWLTPCFDQEQLRLLARIQPQHEMYINHINDQSQRVNFVVCFEVDSKLQIQLLNQHPLIFNF